MELQIKPYEKAQPIEWNFEALKAELAEKVEIYRNLQYTTEQIAAAKTDRAALNNLKKALTDERIRREKEFMEPFRLFKSQINELITMIDVPTKLIDAQVKEFEESEKRKKREDCIKLFNAKKDDGEVPEWLNFEQIENEKWLNKTFTMAKVGEEITERVARIKADTELISALPDYSFEAMEIYKKNLDASAALTEGKNLAELAKRKAEAEKARANAQETNPTPLQTTPKEIPTETTQTEYGANKGQKMVLRFEVEIDAEQARALKAFCDARGITLKRI